MEISPLDRVQKRYSWAKMESFWN